MADHDHNNDHHNDHGHDDPFHLQTGAPVNIDELDPANRSLAEALRISFGVLKVAMIVLIIFFVFSGTRNVDEGRVAVRLLFGSVWGDRGKQVLEPGGPYVWPPEPIGRFIMVPTNEQRLTIDDAFWMKLSKADVGKPIEKITVKFSLSPENDGSLVTGDRNIVHARFTINWRISKTNAVQFVRNVSSDSDPKKMLIAAERLVRHVSERAIVHAVASVTVDDFVRARVDRQAIRLAIRQSLEELNCGITVGDVLLQQPTPPTAALAAFKAVSEAESEKARKIDSARKEASKILNSVAGAGYSKLLKVIDQYEVTRRSKDDARIVVAEANIDRLLSSEHVGGDVADIIRDAEAYRTGAKNQIKGEVASFTEQLPKYTSNPRIFLNRRWTDTLEQILSGDVETFYLPSDPNKELYLELNRDPRIQKKRDIDRFKQQQQQQPR